jgi:predicted nuclease of restriction endonuclease-like (RecB) superfamily
MPPEYRVFLAALKQRIVNARTTAVRAGNREMILLYWDIGQGIVEKQKTSGWGDSVVERLAADLCAAFPNQKGFSAANIWRMRQFFSEYSDPEFLPQLVAEMKRIATGRRNSQILAQPVREFTEEVGHAENLARGVRDLVAVVPWGHHTDLLGRVKDPAARVYYLCATARLGWSRNVLLNQIKAEAFERAKKEKKLHNFALALPEHFAEQADEMMKSRYQLEFLGIGRAVKERQLEDRLVTHLQKFILELGYGFCFIGRQHRLALGRKEYFVDLLFYHRFLKALVAFDLKIGAFEPEHAGKMDFYLNLLNDKERGSDDQPSIGIILCAEKDDVEVEFALKSKTNPIGVAEYQLQAKLPAKFKGRLPDARQLADAVRNALEPEN